MCLSIASGLCYVLHWLLCGGTIVAVSDQIGRGGGALHPHSLVLEYSGSWVAGLADSVKPKPSTLEFGIQDHGI